MSEDRALWSCTIALILGELLGNLSLARSESLLLPGVCLLFCALLGIWTVEGRGKRTQFFAALASVLTYIGGIGLAVETRPLFARGPFVACENTSGTGLPVMCAMKASARVTSAPERPGEGRIRFSADTRLGTEQLHLLVDASDVPWSELSRVRPDDSFSALMDVTLFAPPDQPFSYAAFLMRRGFSGTARIVELVSFDPGSNELSTHDVAIRQLVKTFGPTPELAVSLAGAIGEKDLLDDETKRLFKNTGLTHLLVVSGYQVGMLFGIAYGAARRLMSRSVVLLSYFPVQGIASAAAFLVAGAYTLLIGGVLTTVRALLALAIVAGGRVISRKSNPWRAFAVVLFGAQLIWPGSIFEAGCQLTFAALVGLLLAANWTRRIRQRFSEHPVCAVVLQTIAVSLGAGLFTTPVVLLWFKVFVPLAILYNVVFVAVFSVLFSCVSGAALIAFFLGLPGASHLFRGMLSAGRVGLRALDAGEAYVRTTAFRPRELGTETCVEVALLLSALGGWLLWRTVRSNGLRQRSVGARPEREKRMDGNGARCDASGESPPLVGLPHRAGAEG